LKGAQQIAAHLSVSFFDFPVQTSCLTHTQKLFCLDDLTKKKFDVSNNNKSRSCTSTTRKFPRGMLNAVFLIPNNRKKPKKQCMRASSISHDASIANQKKKPGSLAV
jgi:hypothetical protein